MKLKSAILGVGISVLALSFVADIKPAEARRVRVSGPAVGQAAQGNWTPFWIMVGLSALASCAK
ncbi:MAG: hypothetical protein SWZ49_18700 [Cyanobacteriota bacterium]|nr:hypothetical protein [Cyanobacteriota bacterium]